MSVLLIMAAGAAALMPPTLKPASLVTHRDYPVSAVRKQQEGGVLVSATVDPKGKIIDCRIDRVIGADFGDLVCRKFRKGGFAPATDREGKRIYGLYRGSVNFWLPGPEERPTQPYIRAPELSLSVKPKEGLLAERRVVVLAVLIDHEGAVADCAATKAEDPAQLVDVACAQARAQWRDEPFDHPKGAPQVYARALTVAFEPQSTDP